jgi:hypothetical protein
MMRGRRRSIQVGGPFTSSHVSHWQKRVLKERRILGWADESYPVVPAEDLKEPKHAPYKTKALKNKAKRERRKLRQQQKQLRKQEEERLKLHYLRKQAEEK